MSIADEYHDALVEASEEVSGVVFSLSFSRPASDITPWDPTGSNGGGPWNVVAMEKEREELIPDEADEKEPVSMRVFALSAVDEYVPKHGDSVTLEGREHKISFVEAFSPFGQAINHKIGVID